MRHQFYELNVSPPTSLMHFAPHFISYLFFVSLEKGSIPNMNNIVNLPCLTPEPIKSHSFVDTIHGLTDKLHQLSHLGHDDNKSKSGK